MSEGGSGDARRLMVDRFDPGKDPRGPTHRAIVGVAGFFLGFGVTFCLPFVLAVLTLALGQALAALSLTGASGNVFGVGLIGGMFMGVTQLAWVVPSAIVTLIFRRTRLIGAGILAAAAVVFLLNTLCWGACGAAVGLGGG